MFVFRIWPSISAMGRVGRGIFSPLQNIQHAIRHHIYSSEASMLHLNDTNLVPSQVEQWILII